MISLGTLPEVEATLGRFNTSRDGSVPKSMGMVILHGPGMTVEIPTTNESVTQMIASVHDEDVAWSVLVRICKELDWNMMDVETGRVFGT